MGKFRQLIRIFIPCVAVLLTASCEKIEPKGCERTETLIHNSDPAYIIPIAEDNRWTYVDSVFSVSTGQVSSVDTVQLSIISSFLVDRKTLVRFNDFLPSLELSQDTLYSIRVDGLSGCVVNEIPMFFDPQFETTIPVSDKTRTLRPYSTSVHVPAGEFSNNIVYTEDEVLEMIINKNVGILKIRYLHTEGSETERSLSLIDYNVY